MITKRLGALFGVATTLLAVGLALHRHRPDTPPAAAAHRPVNDRRVDINALAERLSAPVEPTPQQLAEEERVDAQQVAVARAWLRSADPERRIAGAEQLAAYPTRDAEALLTKALAADMAPAVRAAAARGLESFDDPGNAAVQALLHALEDPNSAVRTSALATLQGFVADDILDATGYRKVLAGLLRAKSSRRIDPQTRQWIADYLSDLDSAAAATDQRARH